MDKHQKIRQLAETYVKEYKFPILPLYPYNETNQNGFGGGKFPCIKEWAKHTKTTMRDIKLWFNRNPHINIGMLMGKTDFHYIVGFDMDGAYGEKMLQQLSKGIIPETWEFKTSNGRRLLYVITDTELETKKYKKVAKGVEGEFAIMTTGQQTVMPPSIHPRTLKPYEWVEGKAPWDIEIAECPEWAVQLITGGQEAMPDDPWEQLDDGGKSKKVTMNDFNKVVTEGGRNDHLTKLAGALISKGNIPKEDILSMLKMKNQTNIVPPLPESEVETIMESIYAAEEMKRAQRVEVDKGEKATPTSPVLLANTFLVHQKELGFHYKYVGKRGTFYIFDEKDPPWKNVEDDYLKQQIFNYLATVDLDKTTKKYVSEVLEAVKLTVYNSDDDECFDLELQDRANIYLWNGVYNVKTDKFTAWNPNILSTIRLNADYEDMSDTEHLKYWEKMLKDWVSNDETISFLQEFVGYCLTTDTSLRTGLFLIGEGANGKSMFLDAIQGIFKNHIFSLGLSRIDAQFATAYLLNSLVNISADIDNAYLKKTAEIKKLIAGDTIVGEYKHGKIFTFRPVCKLVFSANELPKSADKTHGWYSRWKIVRFPNRFTPNMNFKQEFEQKMLSKQGRQAILYWAIEGLKRLRKRGDFVISADMKEESSQYKAINDTIAGFCKELLIPIEDVEFDPEEMEPVKTATLYEAYCLWAADMGEKNPASQIQFTRRMKSLGYKKKVRRINGTSSNCFLGVQFKPQDETEFDLHKITTLLGWEGLR